MRRAASIVTAILALTLVASAALASTANYKDKFSNTGYSGSDGSLDWKEAPWQEVNDDGSFKTGKVRSVASGNCPEGNNCLAISGQSLDLVGVGASRPADLDEFETATLNYKLTFVVDDLVTAAFLHVEGRDSGAWAPLRTPYVISNGTLQGSVNLPSLYLDDDFEFRFVVNGLLAGDVYIDVVEITGVFTETTTTTTTSTTSSSTTTTLPITTTLPAITTTTLPGILTTSTSTTTTTKASTSTTEGGATTTSTTSPTSGSSSGGDSGGSDGEGATTTTSGSDESAPGESGATEATTSSVSDGLRQAAVGIQASYDGGRFGDVQGTQLEVMGIAIEPNYSMAVEVIESSWVYLLLLILLIAAAIVSGLDRRRLKRAKHTDV